MEKSIDLLKTTTARNHSKSKDNIKKRTNENKDLIEELGKLRSAAEQRKK